MEIQTYAIMDDPAGPLNYTWPPAAEVTIQDMDGQSNVSDRGLYR